MALWMRTWPGSCSAGASWPEAAAAAGLAAELGYVGPQQAMQQRYDAMDAHLAWILHELGLLQQ
jgi:hypothetical protein